MTNRPALDITLDQLLGREVLARNGTKIGHLEELRCTGKSPYQVTEYVIGMAGLFDRLHVVRAVIGVKPRGYIADAGQIDVSDPRRPTLTCAAEELRRL